eukprot:2887818-Amphidinium_carterae.1
METNWLQSCLSEWQVSGAQVSPAQLSQAGLLGRTARFLAGVERSLLEPAPPENPELGSLREE